VTTLETLQNQVATTERRMSMILDDVTGKMIHFVRNVFTLRVRLYVTVRLDPIHFLL
jgi:hypothetical protein